VVIESRPIWCYLTPSGFTFHSAKIRRCAVAVLPPKERFMSISRRGVLAGLGGLAALNIARALAAGEKCSPLLPALPPAPTLPAKHDFAIPEDVTYINCAYTHPMPRAAVDAATAHAEFRARPDAVAESEPIIDIKAEFAALINAKPSEISFIPNTSTGENLVVNGLDIPRSGGNVVTDALHFEGALLHLGELQRRSGLDLRIVMPRDWRIDLKDLERVIDKKTQLVEISLVAMANGFEHDLKAVCDLAHANGALVYADIVQAAGNTPIDVRASDVDFCACSSFKWLMGDFGLGFLFVKESLLDRVIGRSQYGYYQATTLDSHFLPGDPPANAPYTWQLSPSATGNFEVGTPAIGVAHVLAKSLPYIRAIGVENIVAHRQPLLKRLREEMPKLGFPPLTPPESTSALISFSVKDAAPVREKLKNANVNVRVARDFIRVSPSVFNDLHDVDKLLEALS
jgi:selenocysteine lyase/cysteine desulfurase